MAMDIRDIARLSGYSLGTVSRVMNGHPHVSDRARERVLAVAAAHGYEPNSNARYLKMQARTSIAAFVKGSRNMFFAALVERIQELLFEAGEELHVTYLDEDGDEVQRAVDYLRIRRRKGALFLGGDPACFARGFASIDVPSVLISNTARDLGFENLSSVTTDDRAAAACMIDELVRQGHRHIGIIGGNRAAGQIGSLRLDGAIERLHAYGLPFDAARDYEPCRFSSQDGYEAMQRLMGRSPGVTAVFALGDLIALGAIRAAADTGRTVPGDVSVAGFDDTEAARFSVPRLTTIRQDTDRLAQTGVQTLLDRIADDTLPAIHEHVPFKLLRRESVGTRADATPCHDPR